MTITADYQEIDAALERAAKVREQMFLFMRKLAKEAFAGLDAEADMFDKMKPRL